MTKKLVDTQREISKCTTEETIESQRNRARSKEESNYRPPRK